MKRAIQSVLLILFVCMQTGGHSQILYKVNFHDRDYNKYEGLLVYFNESRAYMRVAYYMPKDKYNVVNVDYKSSTGWFADSSSYFFMTGSNPKFITKKDTGQAYNPDYFIWRKGRYEKNYGSPSTTDDKALKLASEIPVDSFYQLDPYKVSESYLRKYFWSNEADFFALKKLCGQVTTPVNNTNNTGSTLHFVIVANTQIGDIGASCSSDRDKLDYEFRSMAEALGVSYKKYVVDGTNFKKANVQSTLNNLRPGANDIVVFVYRGHGFRWNNQTDPYPMLDLRTSSYMNIETSTSIGLSEIYNTLNAKGARLNIVLGDCCNNNVGLNQMTTTSFLNTQADNKPDVNKLKKLFMNARGNVISAAAHAGEYSWANPFGGFYTLSFIQAMKEKISYFNNGSFNWNDIIVYTTKLAKDKSSPTLCSNCTLQTGVYNVSVTY